MMTTHSQRWRPCSVMARAANPGGHHGGQWSSRATPRRLAIRSFAPACFGFACNLQFTSIKLESPACGPLAWLSGRSRPCRRRPARGTGSACDCPRARRGRRLRRAGGAHGASLSPAHPLCMTYVYNWISQHPRRTNGMRVPRSTHSLLVKLVCISCTLQVYIPLHLRV